MKIRLTHDCGYIGLADVNFPVVVDVLSHSEDLVTFSVSQEAMSHVPGWFWTKDDVWEKCNYIFWRDEVEVVKEIFTDYSRLGS